MLMIILPPLFVSYIPIIKVFIALCLFWSNDVLSLSFFMNSGSASFCLSLSAFLHSADVFPMAAKS